MCHRTCSLEQHLCAPMRSFHSNVMKILLLWISASTCAMGVAGDTALEAALMEMKVFALA